MGLVSKGFTVIVRVQESGLLELSETTDRAWAGNIVPGRSGTGCRLIRKSKADGCEPGLVRKAFTGAVRVHGSGFVELSETPDRAWAGSSMPVARRIQETGEGSQHGSRSAGFSMDEFKSVPNCG